MSQHNPLGEKTVYKQKYDASLLFPIPRSESRQQLTLPETMRGEDRWTAFELSWLDAQGKPQVRVAEFVLGSDSPHIIESKSFKLYLNSFNQTVIESERQLKQILCTDLSAAAGAPISVTLMPLHFAKPLGIQEPIGSYLDDLEVTIEHYQPHPDLLTVDREQRANEVVYSHLLKTNCPVTDQPDWATVFIEYAGSAIDHKSLLQYLISFREHQDFHENSVERIFCDIQQYCQPEKLSVYARYTRRGGLDINPLRSSYPAGQSLLEANCLRTVRQ